MKWKNGRRLDNPQEWKDVKDMFFAIDETSDLSPEDQWDIFDKRNRKKINQAR